MCDRYIARLMVRRALTRDRLAERWQERHNLFAAGNLMPPDPECEKHEDEVMSEVMALLTQLAADKASLTKFVKAKRLGCFG